MSQFEKEELTAMTPEVMTVQNPSTQQCTEQSTEQSHSQSMLRVSIW